MIGASTDANHSTIGGADLDPASNGADATGGARPALGARIEVRLGELAWLHRSTG
jgi:hypothetical protein